MIKTVAKAVNAPDPAVLPVVDSQDVFPVHRIYCVGRNYAAHAVEMGHDPDREAPFFFQKNPDNLLLDGAFTYPPLSDDVQHEIELVVGLKSGGSDITAQEALDCVFGYAVGLDMTRRDLQGEMKRQGRPWEIGKAFEQSAPCSAIFPTDRVGHPQAGAIRLTKNGALAQSGDLSQMIWKVCEIISELSRFFLLCPGDLIFTGTPAGVGSVCQGDILSGEIEGIGSFDVSVT